MELGLLERAPRATQQPVVENAMNAICRSLHAALLLTAVCSAISSSPAAAQSVEDVLTTAWEASWQQTGYPVAVQKWQGPIRVAFSGRAVERHKQHALQELKIVAQVAGLEVAESDEQSANFRVEFIDDEAAEPPHCRANFKSSRFVITSARILAKERSAYGCMQHEAMHAMGFNGHPMLNSVLSYFGRIKALTEVDRLLLKTVYSGDVTPGSSPFALLALLARRLESSAPDAQKNHVRNAAAVFFSRIVTEMEAFAAGTGEPPTVLFRSSKSTGPGTARGQTAMQYFLGVAYLNGELVAADKGKAVEWLTKAAASEHVRARSLLASLEK
jgi:predicted Zn-dependent protease